ncbi:MAG: hypothetical protein IKJ91_00210, partial [Clostridia bacterium]|nr:hypothetical protein [Clostridia bacterium]
MIIDQLSEKPIKENFDSQSYFVGVHTNEEGKKVIVLYPQSGLTEISERASKYAEKSKETAMEAINICKSSLYDGKKVSGNTINIPNEAFSYAKILSIEGLSHIENKTLIPSGLYVENNGDLFSIPEQIISLENYGHGAGEGYNNTIDFERGIYTERCSLFVPEKAINYNEHLTYFFNLGFDIPMERYDEYIKAIETIKCSHSELSFEYYEVVQSEGGTISGGALRVKLNGVVPSEEELQEFIDNQREAGTPVMICYGIPDPVEINISKLISNMHIYITSGTDISFDNGMGTMELYVPKENVASKKYVNQISANALRGKLSGAIVSADDVSPIEHELDIKLTGENVGGTKVIRLGKNFANLAGLPETKKYK